MLHWQSACDVSPEDIGAHPLGIQMYSFRKYDDSALFVVPVDEQGKVHTDYFFCRICRKWLNISTSSTNIVKHINRKHPELTDEARRDITDSEKIAAAKRFILLNCLPFSLVDDKDFKILCPNLERHALSNYATELAEFLIENIKNYIQNSISTVLVIDEWSSISSQPYLGITAHCLFNDT